MSHLSSSISSVRSEALRVLEIFEKVSGLRLNSKKTEALWIGSCFGKREKVFPEKDFNWQNTKVKAFGVWLSMDPEITTKLNFDEKLGKMRNYLSCWSVGRLRARFFTHYSGIRMVGTECSE